LRLDPEFVKAHANLDNLFERPGQLEKMEFHYRELVPKKTTTKKATPKKAMNCKELVEAMAAKKIWTSPGGKTPHATLYSAILREIQTKGKDACFKKTERGKFAANGQTRLDTKRPPVTAAILSLCHRSVCP